jgi:predicted GIY-YIG superfamily endonuclease
MSQLAHCVYILKSLIDGTLYTGSTNNVSQRYIEHELKGSKYTSKKEHLVLIFYSVFIGKDAKEKAIKLEKYLKSGSGRAFIKRHILLEEN